MAMDLHSGDLARIPDICTGTTSVNAVPVVSYAFFAFFASKHPIHMHSSLKSTRGISWLDIAYA